MAEHNSDPKMRIFLKIMQTIALDVHALDTIKDVKTKVCAMKGVGENQQELFFDGDHLSDTTRSLANYKIPNNSTINLYIGEGMQIYVKISPSGKSVTLDVKSRDTIEAVKAKIKSKEGIPLERQELLYLGQSLEEHETLTACNIKNNSILQMVLRPEVMDKLLIFVNKACGKTLTLEARTWFLVKDVKMMIESIEGVNSTRQNLFYNGITLLDHMALSQYEVKDKSNLDLSIKMQIFIKMWSGKSIALSVEENDTVAATVAKLQNKMGSSIKMPTPYYNGKSLEGFRTLGYYHILGGDTLRMRMTV